MPIMFLASRSSLGVTVLALRETGPAEALVSKLLNDAGTPRPLEWGPQASDTAPLAVTLLDALYGGPGGWWGAHLVRLTSRLETVGHDVWILTAAELLAIIGLGS